MIALVFFAVMKWYESYDLGVNAVRAKNYQAGANALSAAIAEMPNELAAVRAGKSIITYTPHFWLGIARYNLDDVDGALREFKTSEEQGVVQTTPYYAQLRDWVARANAEKQRHAENAASGSKREANAAVGRALSAQTDAMAAGADRSDAYRAAQRKLQEALDTNGRAGTDVHAYKSVADLASQARELFAGAAAEARKRKEERPQPLRTVEVNVPFEPAAPPQPPPPMPVESEASVEARIAAQNEKRRLLEAKANVGRVLNPSPDLRAPIENAYRAFAAGDFRKSDALFTQILATNASAEAYLLRGCARYTEAMLMRGKLDAATEDFRAALKLKPALRLDRSAFSPKVIAFFDTVRSGL
jgi:hypothetical protein